MNEPVCDLTAEFVRSILDYDPETGVFTWKRRTPEMFEDGAYPGSRVCATWNTKYAGTEAGTIMAYGGNLYRRILINRRGYKAHRLAWLYVTGEWPAALIDHEDNDGLNNRFANLREATHAENVKNCRRPAHNTSGFKGVSWNRRNRRWVAQICVSRRKIHLGLFDTPEEAHAAYCKAATKFHGEFARVA